MEKFTHCRYCLKKLNASGNKATGIEIDATEIYLLKVGACKSCGKKIQLTVYDDERNETEMSLEDFVCGIPKDKD